MPLPPGHAWKLPENIRPTAAAAPAVGHMTEHMLDRAEDHRRGALD